MGNVAREVYSQIEDTTEDKTLETMLNELQEHCQAKKNSLMCLYEFFNRKQNEFESFDQFYTDLQRLIKNCSFGAVEENLMRVQIVLGIHDKGIQQQLLEKNMELSYTITFCRDMERMKIIRKKKVHKRMTNCYLNDLENALVGKIAFKKGKVNHDNRETIEFCMV